MIGIICAMDAEMAAIKDLMSGVKEDTYYNRQYYVGTLANLEVVVTVCGIGKVASAIVTSQLIERYKPELIINSGVAGGAKAFENTLDLVIADRLTYHDWDNVILFNAPNGFDTNRYSFKTDDQLNNLALKATEGLLKENKAYIGPIVSGDMFVTKQEDVDRIMRDYPETYACDMESCSIAHTCEYYNVKVLIIRALSDIVVKEGNDVDYALLMPKAAVQAAKFTQKFLELYQAK